MAKSSKTDAPVRKDQQLAGYDTVLNDVAELLESARRLGQGTNAVMTTTYWEIGRRIGEFGKRRATHVTQRGNRRADIFFVDEDRKRYLEWLKTYSE